MLSSIGPKQRNGAPGGTRTPNLQLRRLALYPIELRAHSDVPSLPTRLAGCRGRNLDRASIYWGRRPPLSFSFAMAFFSAAAEWRSRRTSSAPNSIFNTRATPPRSVRDGCSANGFGEIERPPKDGSASIPPK